jgi:hypothetical protein
MKATTTAHWHEAYAACPCGGSHDGNALIDDDTRKVIMWRCVVTGQTFGPGESNDEELTLS